VSSMASFNQTFLFNIYLLLLAYILSVKWYRLYITLKYIYIYISNVLHDIKLWTIFIKISVVTNQIFKVKPNYSIKSRTEFLKKCTEFKINLN